MNTTQRSPMLLKLKGIMLKHMHGMITCGEFEEFILTYLENELPKGKRTMFEWHIRLCRECREYLEAYKTSVELGKSVFDSTGKTVLENVPEDLIKAVLESR